jgi:calcium-dependent protein kinase
MKNVDIDRNGWIDYSEFISATIDKRKLLSKERLKAAFSIFDRDENGYISA